MLPQPRRLALPILPWTLLLAACATGGVARQPVSKPSTPALFGRWANEFLERGRIYFESFAFVDDSTIHRHGGVCRAPGDTIENDRNQLRYRIIEPGRLRLCGQLDTFDPPRCNLDSEGFTLRYEIRGDTLIMGNPAPEPRVDMVLIRVRY